MTISLDDWQRSGQEFRHRGQPIFYQDSGQGEVVLLIHGFPTASWDWNRLWPDLSTRFRCIAPDLIGYGFSAKPRRYDYSILDQADLCERLLAARSVQCVHLLAHDYGDTVAQELLARFLERQRSGEAGLNIRSACLLNGGLFPETHRATRLQVLLNSPLGLVLSALVNRRSFCRSLAAVFGPQSQPSAAELDAFWRLARHNQGTRITHKLIRYIDERRQFRERWVGALQHATIPRRLINGPLDPVSGLHMTRRYRELIPDADIVLLDQIGHYPQVENPSGTLQAYLDFVRTATAS